MTRRYPLLDAKTVIYDVEADPQQTTPVDDPALELALTRKLVSLLHCNDAPPELYARYGLAEHLPRGKAAAGSSSIRPW